ncbi:MAG TPA: hypothetical protein VI231_02090 [Candidatus Binatia bacterium]
MSQDDAALREKFSELIAWERTKRIEKVLLEALAYAFLAALLLLPFRGLLARVSPVYYPAAAFALVAAGFFYIRRWRPIDSLCAVFALDRALHLDARALTAAEIVEKQDVSTAERYLLTEAAERLKSVHIRTLFKREWSWPTLAAPALIALWLALVWLGVGSGSGTTANPASPAEKLKEFAQDLEQKSEAQKLAETLKLARALKALAQERLVEKTSEEQFRQGVAAVEKRLDVPVPPPGEFDLGGYTREELAALRAELETAKTRLRPAPTMQEKEFLDRLQSLPRLGEALKRAGGAMENMGPGELRKLLDSLEQQAANELDQRARADVQQFLSMLTRGQEGGDTPTEARIPGRAAQDRSAEGDKSGGKGELPGDEPGMKGQPAQAPVATSGASTRITGALNPGASSGVTWRSETKAGESKIPEQDAPASYRRQMEEELAAEKIPPALKETVKQYFSSLGAEKK